VLPEQEIFHKFTSGEAYELRALCPYRVKSRPGQTGLSLWRDKGSFMLAEYLAILIYFGIAVFFAIFAIVASYLLGQRKPSAIKQAPYECGVATVGSSFRRIPIKYYIIAMLFLIFDIEVVFLYPWAVVFKQFRIFAFVSMAVFIGILLIAYIYIWKKGALEWE
jgi:NADH-quinone oxidoreductase subunit A